MTDEPKGTIAAHWLEPPRDPKPPPAHFLDRIRLFCQDCKADLFINMVLEPVGDYGKSVAVETSAIGTAAFVSTRFFRCGACFIKFMQNRNRPKGKRISENHTK